MPRIKILPEVLSNKIAAGEVIERPASVVKELLENAIDAQSTRILLEVKNGGRSLIRVSDNGVGMEYDDTLLSIERYATSKIQYNSNLFSIQTMGFRGEALPSIAAVSKMILISNDRSDSPGTEIHVEGGKIQKVSRIGAPKGSMITVKDLFFNMPARRKYMKESRTEMGHILDVFDRIALGHPQIQFDLISDGREMKRYSITTSPFGRVMAVFGNIRADKMIEVDLRTIGVSLSGWISSPQETRSTTRWIFIYVNERFVRDRVVLHALMEGYKGMTVKGEFPVAVLFLNVPPDQVDVNVHPTKNEVRFLKSHLIHESVVSHVADVLYRSRKSQWTPVTQYRVPEPSVSETAIPYFPQSKEEEANPKPFISKEFLPKNQSLLWTAPPLDILRVIGQFRNAYILCETKDALILIDQHAAHERILFEQIKKAEKISGQRLLVPETIELSLREMEWFEHLRIPMSEFQFEIEPFGENTIIIKSVPSMLSSADISKIFKEMAEKTIESGFSVSIEQVIDQCLAVVACHGAVRANAPLAKEHMEGLVNELKKCINPGHCPHGRPVFIEWSLNFLEKEFRRVV